MAQNPQQVLQALLDFTQPDFPIALFDEVVVAFYSTGNAALNDVIQKFQSHPDSWTRVLPIIQSSTQLNAKFIALGILESFICTRWNSVGPVEKEGIRNFIVSTILDISQDLSKMKQQRTFLAKLNIVLVNIVKCEWPHNWPTFITEIVESSKTSESVCTNNMQILLLLSEEVFDYSKESMTTEKVNTLRTQLNSEFAKIFELCDYVLKSIENPALLTTTLRTLLRFLRWIPLEFIYDTQLIEILSTRFFPAPAFQNNTLQCLSEIASLEYAAKYGQKYDQLYISMLGQVLSTVYTIIPQTADLNEYHQNGKGSQLLAFLASFLTSFLSKHLAILEVYPESRPTLLASLNMVLRLTLIEHDPTIFVTCLEFWFGFLKDIFRTEQALLQQQNGTAMGLALSNFPGGMGGMGSGNLLGQSPFSAPNGTKDAFQRLAFYQDVLTHLTQVILTRMVKPEEVLIVVDELGNATREKLETTETTSNYNLMRDTISILTTIDSKRVMELICDETQRIIHDSVWKPHALNRLCWAIGSISRALNEMQEKKLLATILKALLSLVDMKKKKDDKAIVASNIMYIVGQYPRFMKQNPTFLTTVLGKLFHFMHDKHPGVQDMAVDTFLTIAQKCRKTILDPPRTIPPGVSAHQFTQLQNEPNRAFINDVLANIKNHTAELTDRTQIYTFYEALATIISADQDASQRDQLLFQLMHLPNESWTKVVVQAKQHGLDTLKDSSAIELLDVTLKTNSRVASAFKNGGYLSQISRLFQEMLVIYRMYSSYINEQITKQGPLATRVVMVRLMTSVRKEILNLLNIFIENASNAAGGNATSDTNIIEQTFLPELIAVVLQDYYTSNPVARDHTVITLFTTIYNLYKRGLKRELVMQIFGAIFPPTIQMLTSNFEDYSEHRKALYYFLNVAVDNYLWVILFTLQPAEVKLVLDSIFWGTKHLTREIQEYSLTTLESILVQFSQAMSQSSTQHKQFNEINPLKICHEFYSQHVFIIVREILFVLTDTFHRSSLHKHCQILSVIIQTVGSGNISIPLQAPQELMQGAQIDMNNNTMVMKVGMSRIIMMLFPQLNLQRVEGLVQALFDAAGDSSKFRTLVTNFLIELREFTPGGNHNNNDD